MSQVISQVEVPTEKAIDREKICPLLLRIFYNNNRHNNISDFSRGSVPPNELQVYTWMDCTLRELMGLIKDVDPDTRKRGTEFKYSIVGPDKRSPHYYMKPIGFTTSGKRGPEDSKTLAQCKFEIGDFIDVSITLPFQHGPSGRNIGSNSGFSNSARRINAGSNGNGGSRGFNNFNRFRD